MRIFSFIGAAALLVASATACAFTPAARGVTSNASGMAARPPAAWSAADLLGRTDQQVVRLAKGFRFPAPPPRREVEEHNVALPGSLAGNVNEVVPIPGTDLVRVGAMTDGVSSQTSNRNAAQESRRQEGNTPTGATVIFRINRP